MVSVSQMRWLLLVAVLGGCWRDKPGPVTPREQKRDAPKPVAGGTGLTAETALAKIEDTYRGGVQRCYEVWLKTDPGARGELTLTFTVDNKGKLTFREARGIHRSVEQCVEGAMLKWTFPPATQEETFRLALQLSSGA